MWKGWTCDELTPDLCDLDVDEGAVTVRGISISYWRYKSPRKRHGDHWHMDHKKGAATRDSNKVPGELPVVLVHGGPSWSHNYMLPLKQIACRGNREVVFYDQGGCGASSIPPGGQAIDDYPWLLNASYYATEELPALIAHLGYDKFHILGHSWGAMVAQLYALDAPKQGLQSLVLSAPINDASLFAKSMWEEQGAHGGISSLPPFLQSRIRAVESQKAFDSEEYKALDTTFLNMFLTRVQPIPGCLAKSFAVLNPDIYMGLLGPNDFVIGGSLVDFNTTGRLYSINVPVLLSNGEYDFVRPQVLDVMERQLPNVERVLFSKSAHNSMLDEAGLMNEAVSDFLCRMEQSLEHKNEIHHRKGNGKDAGKTLASFLPKNMSSGNENMISASIHSGFVLTTTFLVGLIVGLFLNSRQVRRPGYETF